MALNKIKCETISVVAFQDDCVSCPRETYDDYLSDLDEAKLQLSGTPTRFMLRLVLGYEEQKKIENSRVAMNSNDRSMAIATSSMPEMRAALVGITCPPDQLEADRIEFKKDTDGLVSKTLIADLNALGVCADLQFARSNAVAKTQVNQKKLKPL